MTPSQTLRLAAKTICESELIITKLNIPNDAAYSYLTDNLHQSADYSFWDKAKIFIHGIDDREPSFTSKEHAVIALCLAADIAEQGEVK